MIELGRHPKGVVLNVRAQPRARQARIVAVHGGAVKVAVTEAPEKGKANEAIIEVLCAQLRLKRSQVFLLSGETSRNKKFLLVGVESNDLCVRIDRFLAGGKP